MKKWLIIVLPLVLFGKYSFSQVEVRPAVKLSESFSMYNIITGLCCESAVESTDFYLETFGKIGASIKSKKVEYLILGSYGLEHVLGKKGYRSHLLGISLQFRFQQERKFGFLLSINGHNQIKSNYYLSYLDTDGLNIRDAPGGIRHSLGSHGGPPYYMIYYSRFYIKTPFVGNILTGVDFRAFDGFHITASVGFGLRIMKTKYAEWSVSDLYEEDVYEKLKSIPIETYYLSAMDFELGVRYAFPLKKTSKAQ